MSDQNIRRSLVSFGICFLLWRAIKGLVLDSFLWLDALSIGAIFLGCQFSAKERETVHWSLLLSGTDALLTIVALLTFHANDGVLRKAEMAGHWLPEAIVTAAAVRLAWDVLHLFAISHTWAQSHGTP